MREMSRQGGSAAGSSSQEIPSGDPIVPPYNGSKKLPVARLLYSDEPTGAPKGLT